MATEDRFMHTGAASFGPVHVIEPQTQHTHTVILLHGRGSSGQEFAEELFESQLSDQASLADRFRGWRWVFPSSPDVWSSTFEEDIAAWFDVQSLTDIHAAQQLQIPELRASVKYVSSLIDEEIMKLGGRGDKLVLGGISLGGATAIWSLLCSDTARRLGAFFAASTWLPFHNNIKRLANIMASSSTNTEPQFGLTDSDKFVENTIAPFLRSHASTQAPGPLMSTPVFIGHGSDDAYVDVILGRQARDVLRQFGFNVEWREYSGADQEGHWLKCPEEVDDIASFLSAQLT